MKYMSRQEYLQQHWKSYPEVPVSYQICGRIFSINRDAGLKLEIYSENKLHKVQFAQAPWMSEYLDVGDLIAVVNSEQIVLLAPQLQALPKAKANAERLKQWNQFIAEIRQFFVERDFLEVKTPSLVICPGTEPSLDVFSTELIVGSRKQTLFLPTSPELHLKKALSLGLEKIFEFAPCFRNGEITERHQPEFLMLEWYRAFANNEHIKKDVIELVQKLAKKLQLMPPQKVVFKTVADLFKEYCDFDLKPETSMQDLQDLAHKLGVDVHSAESIDDIFFLIFMDKIESQLPVEDLIFVEKYPPYQAALARLTADGWGDRFEVYWKGLELANAFHELNDPRIQRARFAEDLSKKMHMGKQEIPIDEDFMQCLEAGMPPSAGIALGVERLFMAFYDLKNIRDIKLFSVGRS